MLETFFMVFLVLVGCISAADVRPWAVGETGKPFAARRKKRTGLPFEIEHVCGCGAAPLPPAATARPDVPFVRGSSQ
jgi:hypothetical protein